MATSKIKFTATAADVDSVGKAFWSATSNRDVAAWQLSAIAANMIRVGDYSSITAATGAVAEATGVNARSIANNCGRLRKAYADVASVDWDTALSYARAAAKARVLTAVMGSADHWTAYSNACATVGTAKAIAAVRQATAQAKADTAKGAKGDTAKDDTAKDDTAKDDTAKDDTAKDDTADVAQRVARPAAVATAPAVVIPQGMPLEDAASLLAVSLSDKGKALIGMLAVALASDPAFIVGQADWLAFDADNAAK